MTVAVSLKKKWKKKSWLANNNSPVRPQRESTSRDVIECCNEVGCACRILKGGGGATGEPLGRTSHQETYGCTLKITNTPTGTERQLLQTSCFTLGDKSIKVNANVLISNKCFLLHQIALIRLMEYEVKIVPPVSSSEKRCFISESCLNSRCVWRRSLSLCSLSSWRCYLVEKEPYG